MTVALDTNIALLHLGGRLDAPLPEGPWITSVITELEMLSYGPLDEKAETQIRLFLGKVRVVDLTPLVKDAAVTLRRQHGLKLPDAIIAGTALSLDAELLTNDARLLKLPELRARPVPVRR